MQQIADWLKQLGMSEHAQRFTEIISMSRLRRLSDQDLPDIGVPPRASAKDARGHQLAYQRGPATPEPAARVEPKTQDTAERRQLTVMSTDLVGSRALDEARSRRPKSENDHEVL
jgi:class 3 adenylate cyclase